MPPFAGFWSKDEILLFSLDKSPALYVIGLVTALLTAYYMTRQVIMVFFGEAHWKDQARRARRPRRACTATPHESAHESPWIMLVPLVVLAALSIVGGLIQLPFSDDVGAPRALAAPGGRAGEVDIGEATWADDDLRTC